MGSFRLAVFALVSLSVSIGCGSERTPEVDGAGGTAGATGAGGSGGDGGTGGTGATGGAGGTGSTGGTGGSEPRCGDGNLDPSESCDDGNVTDGDGCSSSCEWEGSCDSPIDFAMVSVVPDPEFPNFRTTGPVAVVDMGVPGVGRCGGGGAKRVLRYVAPATGRLIHIFQAVGKGANDARSYVRRACDDPETNVWMACQMSSETGLVHMDAVEGEVFYFIADAIDPGPGMYFLMAAEVFPYRDEGASCGPASGLTRDHMWQCAPGFTCRDIANPDSCSPNEAPTLASVRALRGGGSGTDLIAILELEDPNADYWMNDAFLYDGDGSPVVVNPRPGAFDFDPNQVSFNLERSLDAAPTLRTFGVMSDLFGRHPEVERLSFRTRDFGWLTSNVLEATVEPQPLMAQDEPCDLLMAESRCESDDLVCRGPSRFEAACESREPDRVAACADPFAEVGVGSVLEFEWSRSEFDRPADWPIPWGCFETKSRADQRLQRPERVFRLHLDEPRTNVSIRTGFAGDSSLTAIALYEGCGLQGPPLACNENDPASRNTSRLDLPALDAGDYLLVVSLPDRPQWRFKVIVEADPLPDP